MSSAAVAFSPIGIDTQTDEKLPWYGVRTRSNHEKIAATVLGSKGYEQYLPVCRVKRRWSDRIVVTEQPLFPGYVFCRFDRTKRLPVMTTPGVVSIVGCGNEPAPIEEHEVEAIQVLLRSGLATEPCPFLREGQRVRIKSGPLRELEGILTKKKSDFRFVLSVSILQRSVSVEIDRDWITTV